jgi:hypothetical protein
MCKHLDDPFILVPEIGVSRQFPCHPFVIGASSRAFPMTLAESLNFGLPHLIHEYHLTTRT